MEILPGVHCIESVFKHRFLKLYLLAGKHALLIDSGFSFTPAEIILPYLTQMSMPMDQIKWLVVTHASGDHCGGNYAIKSRSPGTTIVAHELDADCIASHATFIGEHIDWAREYDLPFPAARADDPQFLALYGPETPVDWRVRGGETLDLGDGWSVTLLHAPGHTPGHLVVYDTRYGAVFAGDALMGEGVPDVNGNLVMPPHYFEVDWYLETIAKVRALNPQYILATHYEPLVGRAITEFLDASEVFAARCHSAIVRILESSRGSLDTLSIIEALRSRIGIPAADNQYALLVRAHLTKLTKQGRVVLVKEKDRKLWQRSS